MSRTTVNQLRSRLDRTNARTVLVRGANAPSRPPETVTVAPGVHARVTPEERCAPLRVTAEEASGRTIREYDDTDARAVADCATTLVADRGPRAVWLCGRAQIRSWWCDGVASLLERRLDAAARDADARLVVWTAEEDGAVGDRYDVVLDP